MSDLHLARDTAMNAGQDRPWGSGTDSDTNDVYPNEIRGLVHVTGNVQLKDTSRIVGALIVEGSASVSGDPEFIIDPNLSLMPPGGYTGSLVHGWTCERSP